MKHIIAAILAGASLAILAGSVTAQELGDARRGRNLAESVCAECHAVQKGALRSRNGNAPAFETVATTPGMTPMAIRVALRTSHREMPNLVLKNQDVDDVIAYLATLK
jgi:cytochrome c2